MSRSPSSFFSQKKTRILFYQTGMKGWIKVNVLVFKTFIETLYPVLAEKLEWLLPIQDAMTDEGLIRHIKQNNVDILCTSHYLWNHDFLTNQLSRIKSKLTLRAVIAGGPSIDVNNNQGFFDQHPYIDYAVYGAGEQAFADIVSHLVLETPMIAFNTSNCAWKHGQTGKTTVADYKFVKMLETSPFVHNAELFGRMVENAKKTNVTNIDEWVPYTLTRGCPYACTFCDWNSGLGNKISRRKNTYREEIDLFQKLGLKNIYLSDANVGQYDEDVDMVMYFAQKNLQEDAGFRISGNYSKLKKENNLKMFNIMAESGLVQYTFNFAVQDINEQVLKNIDRPDVGWDVHAAMADELTTRHPQLIVKAQLIYGLPGQTPLTWRETLRQITQKNILPIVFLNEPLPASPAVYDPEYQRKFQFEYVKSTRINPNFDLYVSEIPKKCISFDQQDLAKMTVLSGFYNALSVIKFIMIRHTGMHIDIEPVIDNLLTSNGYRILCDNLYTNWINEQNFYFTQDFLGNPTIRSCEPMSFGGWLTVNDSFILYVLKLLPKESAKKLFQLTVKDNFKQVANELCNEID